MFVFGGEQEWIEPPGTFPIRKMLTVNHRIMTEIQDSVGWLSVTIWL